jgi:ABC-type molybdate transport system substrate-binding protein
MFVQGFIWRGLVFKTLDAVSRSHCQAIAMRRLLDGRALRSCARADTPLGIVYETDVMVEKRASSSTFCPELHAPITFRVAPVATAKAASGRFVGYLKSLEGHAVFAPSGFQNGS